MRRAVDLPAGAGRWPAPLGELIDAGIEIG